MVLSMKWYDARIKVIDAIRGVVNFTIVTGEYDTWDSRIDPRAAARILTCDKGGEATVSPVWFATHITRLPENAPPSAPSLNKLVRKYGAPA